MSRAGQVVRRGFIALQTCDRRGKKIGPPLGHDDPRIADDFRNRAGIGADHRHAEGHGLDQDVAELFRPAGRRAAWQRQSVESSDEVRRQVAGDRAHESDPARNPQGRGPLLEFLPRLAFSDENASRTRSLRYGVQQIEDAFLLIEASDVPDRETGLFKCAQRCNPGGIDLFHADLRDHRAGAGITVMPRGCRRTLGAAENMIESPIIPIRRRLPPSAFHGDVLPDKLRHAAAEALHAAHGLQGGQTSGFGLDVDDVGFEATQGAAQAARRKEIPPHIAVPMNRQGETVDAGAGLKLARAEIPLQPDGRRNEQNGLHQIGEPVQLSAIGFEDVRVSDHRDAHEIASR